jgi:hypothetical protein
MYSLKNIALSSLAAGLLFSPLAFADGDDVRHFVECSDGSGSINGIIAEGIFGLYGFSGVNHEPFDASAPTRQYLGDFYGQEVVASADSSLAQGGDGAFDIVIKDAQGESAQEYHFKCVTIASGR